MELKTLGEAELEIMQILWAAREPVTARAVQDAMASVRPWPLSNVMGALDRLCRKGYAVCDRSTRTNRYRAVISARTFQREAGRDIFRRVYNRSLPDLVASLYDSRSIGAAELDELRAYLDELEGRDE